jgi:hypothetical protein
MSDAKNPNLFQIRTASARGPWSVKTALELQAIRGLKPRGCEIETTHRIFAWRTSIKMVVAWLALAPIETAWPLRGRFAVIVPRRRQAASTTLLQIAILNMGRVST